MQSSKRSRGANLDNLNQTYIDQNQKGMSEDFYFQTQVHDTVKNI